MTAASDILELSAGKEVRAVERRYCATHPLVLAAPAILLASLLLLPFLHKAFEIDDSMDLLASMHALRDFWHPLRFDMCWDDPSVCRPANQIIPNVTLIAYFLLPASWLGSPEWLVHVMQFGVLCLGITATVSIASRIGCNRFEAVSAGLLLASLPAVLAYTNGATPDIPAMSLGAAGIDRLLKWREDRSLRSALAAAVLLGMAPLARVHLILLLPIAALAIGAEKRLRAGRFALAAWPIMASIPIFALGLMLAKGGNNSLTPVAPRLTGAGYVVYNTLSYFWYLILPFPVGLAWMLGNGRRGASLALGGIGTFLALTQLGKVDVRTATIAVGACCGAIILLAIVWRAGRERREYLLFAGWAAIPLMAVAYVHLPPKYLVGAAPAIVLLMIVFLRRSRWPAIGAGALIAGGIVLSFLALRADAEFAEAARVTAQELVRPRIAEGRSVWFTGEWGIYWYAQRAGAQVLMPGGPQPARGDFLLVGAEGAAGDLDRRFPRRTLIERREYRSRFGRTMNHGAGAGLHSNVMGPFVWVPSNGYLDSYELWRID